jgi:uncharacterized protein RhaS with RHS repeats
MLLHVGERWYQPGIGRFVQRDPIGLAAGVNVYAYVRNRPIASLDPRGLAALPPPTAGMDVFIPSVSDLMETPFSVLSEYAGAFCVAATVGWEVGQWLDRNTMIVDWTASILTGLDEGGAPLPPAPWGRRWILPGD